MFLRVHDEAPDEISRGLDSIQLTIAHKAGTPANWKQGASRSYLRILRQVILALAIASVAPSSWGSSLQYVVSGQFSGNAPATVLTEPDADFSITFAFDSSPSPYASLANQSDLLLPASTVYEVAGHPVSLGATNTIGLFTPSANGGIGIILTDAALNQLALYFQGPQIFTGPTSAPNLIFPETYLPSLSAARWVYFLNGSQFANGAIAQASVTNAPEPSSIAFVWIGFAIPLLLRSRRFILTKCGVKEVSDGGC